jgi:hypothetical protein
VFGTASCALRPRSLTGFQARRNGLARALRACLIVIAVGRVSGQENGQPQFEAASVKLHTIASPSTGRSGVEETPGLIRIENLSLKTVIGIAYGVKNSQIEGPGWLDTVPVDITAKPPRGYEHGQLQPLLRNLLTDRFKLAVHHESKQTSPPTSADEQKDAPEPGPSLFAALNDQLGLRLQTRKVPVDVVLVDRMERVPTEN